MEAAISIIKRRSDTSDLIKEFYFFNFPVAFNATVALTFKLKDFKSEWSRLFAKWKELWNIVWWPRETFIAITKELGCLGHLIKWVPPSSNLMRGCQTSSPPLYDVRTYVVSVRSISTDSKLAVFLWGLL